jgi:hypothetical protein
VKRESDAYRSALALARALLREHVDVRETYLNLPEVLADIGRCDEVVEGRKITAVLRVMGDQVHARDPYLNTITTLWLALGICVACLASSAIGYVCHLRPWAEMFLMGMACFSLVAAAITGADVFRAGSATSLYVREIRAIESRAASAILSFANIDAMPHRLSRDDVENLKRLAKRYPRLRHVAARYQTYLSDLTASESRLKSEK